MKFTQLLRYFLKFVVAAVWVVVLPVSFSSSLQNPSGLIEFVTHWAGDWGPGSLYYYVVAIYMIPNIVAAILFFLPPMRRTLERSNMRIITLLMWWAQVRNTIIGDFSLFYVYPDASFVIYFRPFSNFDFYSSQSCMLVGACTRACFH